MKGFSLRHVVNFVMLGLTGLCTVATLSLLFFILGFLVYNGAASLRWSFFTSLPVPVGEAGGGIANGMVGSLKVLALATAIGIPIGFLGGVYLSEYSQATVSFVIRYVTDLLNGVPSIVMGIVVYGLVVRRMGHFSTFAGGVALGIMMIPISVRSTEEFLHNIPVSLREAAFALGASKSRTIVTVVVPAAMRGIISGTMLDVARVAGETAPLLFTALGNPFWSAGWNEPTATLPVMIYTYAISPYDEWHRLAWAAGFVLLATVLLINIGARSVLARGISIPR